MMMTRAQSKRWDDLSPTLALWLMVGVLSLSGALALVNLNAVSFWEDESWLAIGMSGSAADLWRFAAERGVHPPLYFFIAYGLKPFIGDGEVALRWLSGLIGLVGVAWTYRLGATLADRRTGVIAALLVAGSIFLVYFARLARHYTLFYALSAATVWAYARWHPHPADRGRLGWLVGLQAANLYTHYFSAFVALTLALHSLLTLPLARTRRLWLGLLVSGLLFLPWVPAIATQLNSDFSSGLYYGVPDMPRVLENYVGRVTNANFALGAILSGLGCWALWQRRQGHLALLVFIWIVGTFVPVLLVNEYVFMWYIGRNMLYTLPAVVFLYGLGLSHLWQYRAGRVVAAACCAVFVGYGVIVYEAFWPRTPDWRSAARGIAAQAVPQDRFIVAGETYSLDYYFRRYFGEPVSFENIDEWQRVPDITTSLWLIDGLRNGLPGRVLNRLPPTMQRTHQIIHEPIVAEFYQQRPAGIAATFGDQIALGSPHQREINGRAGDALVLDVWWQALRLPDFNYSVSVQIIGAGGVVAQHDGNFDGLDAQVLPVGAWSPDRRVIALPPTTAPGRYPIGIAVYDWRDGTRLSVTPVPGTSDHLFRIGTAVIAAAQE